MGAAGRVGAGVLVAGTIALVAGGIRSVPAGSAAPSEPQRPNVVVVMTDDQTLGSLSVMVHVASELADKGATFENNFTNWPLCCPSRATFYSGQYAHNHGVLGNQPPLGGFTRFDDSNALPVWLQAAGYRTIHIGKYLNGYGELGVDPAYVPPGWTEWYAPTNQTIQRVYDYTLNQNGALVGYGTDAEDFKQDVFSDLAVDAINRNAAGGPFFLAVMYTAPHAGGPNPNLQPPSNCSNTAKPAPRHATAFDTAALPQPPSFNEADVSDKPAAIGALGQFGAEELANIQRRYRCRLESLLSVDEGVDRILGALRLVGELDDTLLIFTSDNGFFAGEHRVQTGKNRVYEEAIRVPLVIRGPGVPRGVTVDDLSINADLAPTIVDAADATAGRVEDGRSLLPFATHPDRMHGRELLIEEGNQGDDEDNVNGFGYSAVRTSRYLYVDNASGEIELYDLDRDPFELANAHGDPAYAKVEPRLAARLASLRGCAGSGCRTKPDLRLKLPKSNLDHGRACRDARRFIVRVRGSAGRGLVGAGFRVAGRSARDDHRAPFKDRIDPRLLRHSARPEIRVSADLVDGRELTLRKRVRICR
jgi:arylsulfatase A-like enzyme